MGKSANIEKQDIFLFFFYLEELFLDADNGPAKGLCEFCEKGFVEKSDPFG